MRALALASGWFAVIGAVAWFAGCGSSIEMTGTGGSGAAGTGTATTTTATGMTAVSSSGTGGAAVSSSSSGMTTTVSVSSSSSTGGPDPTCEAACMHAASCGTDVCMQYGITCNQVNAQLDCIAQCIANLPCPISGGAALGCLQMCKGGSSSSSSSGSGTSSVASSSSSSGMANSCQQCSVQSCQSPLAACAVNTACRAWLQCVTPCNQQTPLDPTCFAACDTANAGASGLYDPIYACSCSSCMTECGSIPECGGGDGG